MAWNAISRSRLRSRLTSRTINAAPVKFPSLSRMAAAFSITAMVALSLRTMIAAASDSSWSRRARAMGSGNAVPSDSETSEKISLR